MSIISLRTSFPARFSDFSISRIRLGNPTIMAIRPRINKSIVVSCGEGMLISSRISVISSMAIASVVHSVSSSEVDIATLFA